MKTGLFFKPIDNKRLSYTEKIFRVGNNTGNLAFYRALKKLFDPILIPPEIREEDFEHYYSSVDAFITTELIWIRQEDTYGHVKRTLKMIKDKPLIPISVGLQHYACASDFSINPDTISLLKEIEERCVIGVRGDYTAYILKKHGIKNISVIGCPSVFYKDNYSFIEPENANDIKACSNFITLYRNLKDSENSLLSYFMSKKMGFIEQTLMYDIDNHARYDEWFTCEKRLFFDTNEWDSYLRDFEFSIGMRFHGNVMALQNNMRALTITSDSRTKELTEFFSLPSISIEDFDDTKPLLYYYKKANPEAFLKKYPSLKQNFQNFANKNNLVANLK